MSSKAIKKYGDIKVPCASLQPGDKEGWLTKVGGSVKTWKKRYFVLKDRTLYYYKTPKDVVFTGKLDLEPGSIVKEDSGKKKPNLISITTSKRVFFMHPVEEKEKGTEVMRAWIEAISRGIDKAKTNGAPGGASPASPNGNAPISNGPSDSGSHGGSSSSSSGAGSNPNASASAAPAGPPSGATRIARANLAAAKDAVPFLKDEESKVLEFWQIWSESIPSRDDLTPGMAIDFLVATSADMQKLTWRTSGPQNIFIQKMVDFFWNVGAPESEIDRLNDVGAQINPHRIGSWIDMSAKGGMDGGWFFPTDMTLAIAASAADEGRAITQFLEWAETRAAGVLSVGRDMGAAPPRQTEIRLRLAGETSNLQLAIGLDAFNMFGFPPIPDEPLAILKRSEINIGLLLSVITSAEGFVRLGLQIPRPNPMMVRELCASVSGGNPDELLQFERSLNADGPAYVEFQILMKGFGYGVYKEGFDVVFHYSAGTEEL
eukprot:TRINITY_DN3948_c0_g1_i1.p2 TRINITY_DN3948_c0_g1~~TRINITY_DN3948_c0_g1_i1.p2  ORF type:complete len:488 (+),score=180.43 TRINITY_DN3948_c0_g1_i1:157-1620(+)